MSAGTIETFCYSKNTSKDHLLYDLVGYYIQWIQRTHNYLLIFNKRQNLAWTELKAFADDKFHVDKLVSSDLDRVENTVGKGENAGCQHFLLFQRCFQKASSPGLGKPSIV